MRIHFVELKVHLKGMPDRAVAIAVTLCPAPLQKYKYSAKNKNSILACRLSANTRSITMADV